MSGEPNVPFGMALIVYLTWTVIFIIGHVRDFFAQFAFWAPRKDRSGYAPLRQDYEDFYTRRAYYRLVDCFARPVAGPPDRLMDVVIRSAPKKQQYLKNTGEIRKCINLGSYNYLGFANQDAYCTPRCHTELDTLSASTCSSRDSGGTTQALLDLEACVARYLGQDAAMVLGMGFATNSAVIPAFCGVGDLIISDALNHTSIVAGVRGSGARVRVFKHNNVDHLERVIRTAVADGQPRTHRPWRKIIVIVEGIYSMEGEVCALREVVAVTKKYKCYVYLDEAHSIGAMGATGRGVCEHLGIDFADIDLFMGTFTKSFGSCGGYVAGSHAAISHLKAHSPAHVQSAAMSPVATQQILSAFQLILGAENSTRGMEKLTQLKDNANYFRKSLLDLGFEVLGDWDSPVMPIMLYSPGAVATFSRECLRLHIAVVVVGFPATSLVAARARVCISAAHKRSDLDYALYVFEKIGREIGVLLNAKPGQSASQRHGFVRRQISELSAGGINGKGHLL